ncbi:uncharacterized protein [Euwallacea similis]|uniref:uncharacterized protein n=1 Tax=Euwallacea similis TaxID=1736056 RepID=UPI00344BBF07
MSFPTSSRFPKYEIYSPSPNSYNVLLNAPNQRYPILRASSTQCLASSKCDVSCCRFRCTKCWNRDPQGQTKRHSLGPYHHCQEFKPRPSLSANNENLENPQKSQIPVKTIQKAPKPKVLNISHSSEVFNRHALMRKSVKPIKRVTKGSESFSEDSLEEVKAKRLFASYTMLPKVYEEEVGVVTFKGVNNKEDNFNVNTPSSPIKTKERKLLNELSSDSIRYYQLTSGEGKEDLSLSYGDCRILLLINEEFIDDEIDSYVKGGGAKVVDNTELLEMTSNLVRMLRTMEDEGVTEKSRVKGNIGFKKHGKRRMNKNLNNNLDGLIRAAINGLRGEFLNKIYETTSLKMDQTLLDLKSLVLKANEDIENACERTSLSLISRLKKFDQKQLF